MALSNRVLHAVAAAWTKPYYACGGVCDEQNQLSTPVSSNKVSTV